MPTVQIYSRRLSLVTAVLQWLVPLAWIAIATVATMHGDPELPGGPADASQLQLSSKIAFVLLTSIAPLLLGLMLRELHQLLLLYAGGEVFTAPAVVRGVAARHRDAVATRALPTYIYEAATPRTRVTPRHFAYVKVAEGCDYNCSFCIIPALRGQYRSRPADDILTEARALAADGLRQLCEVADPYGLNVIVENHGGLSSNGAWLSGVMKQAAHPRVGTLPDFGNFRIKDGEEYDRYTGTAELMPFARGVSAKSYDFDEKTGDEVRMDYRRLLKIVLDADYHGRVGIEYEGSKLSEPEGIRATKRLLEKVRGEMAEKK